ncbi:hypothetical protein DFH06DRAFT_1320928 [Mycena polygramma]|nr:hypothetical protein DFH06DRAFT_1320928 [Mycena polygramma]
MGLISTTPATLLRRANTFLALAGILSSFLTRAISIPLASCGNARKGADSASSDHHAVLVSFSTHSDAELHPYLLPQQGPFFLFLTSPTPSPPRAALVIRAPALLRLSDTPVCLARSLLTTSTL